MADNPPRYIRQRESGKWQVRLPGGGTYDSREDAIAARDRLLEEPEQDERLQDICEGNNRCVTYVSPDVRTLDDLIAACKIDTNIWTITRWEANKWAVGAKVAKRTLTFDAGAMTGEIDDPGTLTVAPIFQVKAWMVRKEPVALHPVVQPVLITVSHLERPTGRRDGLWRDLICGDAQIGFRKDQRTGQLEPFHDRAALDVVLQVAQEYRFDHIRIAGDWLDCTEGTDKYTREEGFWFTTQPAVCEASWWIAQLSQVAAMEVAEGNHERRLPHWLLDHALWSYGLRPADEVQQPSAMSIERLLCLDKLGVKWIGGYPDNLVWLTDNLAYEHGSIARSGIGDTAARVAERPYSTVFLHIHRREQATRTEYRHGQTETITALCPGCLCRIDGTVPGHSRDANWQQGFAVVTYCGDYHTIEAVEIRNGKAAFGGKLYEARDQTGQLRADTGWNF